MKNNSAPANETAEKSYMNNKHATSPSQCYGIRQVLLVSYCEGAAGRQVVGAGWEVVRPFTSGTGVARHTRGEQR